MKIRQIDAMAKRLDNYESLLRELGLRADEKDQKRILNALDRVNTDSPNPWTGHLLKSLPIRKTS